MEWILKFLGGFTLASLVFWPYEEWEDGPADWGWDLTQNVRQSF